MSKPKIFATITLTLSHPVSGAALKSAVSATADALEFVGFHSESADAGSGERIGLTSGYVFRRFLVAPSTLTDVVHPGRRYDHLVITSETWDKPFNPVGYGQAMVDAALWAFVNALHRHMNVSFALEVRLPDRRPSGRALLAAARAASTEGEFHTAREVGSEFAGQYAPDGNKSILVMGAPQLCERSGIILSRRYTTVWLMCYSWSLPYYPQDGRLLTIEPRIRFAQRLLEALG